MNNTTLNASSLGADAQQTADQEVQVQRVSEPSVVIDGQLMPADIAAMSVGQLARLNPSQKLQLDRNLDEAMAWLRKARAKFDAALEQSYGDAMRAALAQSGRDFGVSHITDGDLHIKCEQSKKVSWDQKKLHEIAKRIVESGEQVESYMDIKLAITETRYANWPPALQEQFAAARTVEGGKASFELNWEEQ